VDGRCLPLAVAPGCAALPLCSQACQEVGSSIPYFAVSASPEDLPTAGGALSLRGFFGDPAGLVVWHQGSPLTLQGATETEVVVVAPAGTADTELTVTAAGGVPVPLLEQDALGAFVARPTLPLRYRPPQVESVSGCVDQFPRTFVCSPWAGNVLVIQGQQLGDDAAQLEVSVGGVACDNLSVLVPHQTISCDLPPREVGGFDLDLTVTRSGTSATLPSAVSYNGPLIEDVFPTGDLDPHGAETLTITGVNFDFPLEVRFGPPGSEFELEFECVPTLSTSTMIECTTPPGTGVGLVLRVRSAAIWSRPATQTVSYRAPAIAGSTLRLGPTGLTSNALEVSQVPAEVYFDVLDLPAIPSLFSVWLSDGAGEQECLDPVALAQSGSITRVGCLLWTNLSTQGEPLGLSNFIIRVPGAESARGTDTLSFPQVPAVTSISGCTDVPPDTLDCPTEGGRTLTAKLSFAPVNPVVTVAGVAVPVTRVDAETVELPLPAGVGTVPVAVVDPSGRFAPARLLGYAPPRVLQVRGCTDSGATTLGCPRTGSTPLTVEGTSFGPSGAIVLVGGKACTGVTHDAATPHRKLSCTLPAGSGTGVPVVVVSGQVASNEGTLSYLP
jgi:hypothetical protein